MGRGIAEHVFEEATPDFLIGAIEARQRQESVLMAQRLAAIAALLWLRISQAEEADPDPGYTMITGFARTSAEVSAAMNLSPMGANHLVAQTEAVDTRLPKVAALLAAGTTDWRTVQVIIARTQLVSDSLIARVDHSLADRIGRWQCWSRRRLINAVDAAVHTIDPDAAKEHRVRADDDRHVGVTPLPDGMARVRGSLSATAGAVFDKRLSQMATSMCGRDSRTIAQRRADAVTALCAGRALACDCGQPDCPTRGADTEAPPSGVRTVINVIATEDTVTGNSAQPGYLEGYGVIDAEHVRQLAETSTRLTVECPPVSAAEAVRYQPSAALQRWIRCRDLTCRFPGCDRPAWKPIVDRDVWESVRRYLADPKRFTGRSMGRKHLLSGIAYCGECGKRMGTCLKPTKSGSKRVVYQCKNVGCMKIVRDLQHRVDRDHMESDHWLRSDLPGMRQLLCLDAGEAAQGDGVTQIPG